MRETEFVLLGIGAVAGAFLRYKITSSPLLLGILPVNVLIVNVTGSFILGIFSIMALSLNLDAKYSLLIAVGFCGSLTTMSSFAFETSEMLDDRAFTNMGINILANVGLSVGAVIGGRSLMGAILEGGLK
jgi:fluoride exporter